MAEVKSNETSPIGQEEADKIARQLNIIFNTATLYGGDHPSTKKCAGDFAEFVKGVFTVVEMLTILKMGESLYIEKSCVDHRMNSPRIIAYFDRIGIESISFRKGLNKEDVRVFIKVFSDIKYHPTVDKMKKTLKNNGVTNILFNYVFLQKITQDDAVVDKDVLVEEEHKLEEKQIFEQIGRLFSLKDLVDNPGYIAQNILAKSEERGDGRYGVISQLKEIHKQIQDSGSRDTSLSMDEVMESFFELASQLKNQLSIQKEEGKLDKEEGLVIDEIEEITYDTIIQIVRDEYKHGEISIKRLGQIIRRVLPDIKDLKKLLPRLKKALMEDGMSLSDFLQLTIELNKELQSDGLLEKLEHGAEQIGVTVEDIIQAFSTNPSEAAKIIILASEINGSVGEDHIQMSSFLADYIESVSTKMTLNSPQTSDKSGGKVLGKIIHQIESQLVEKLKAQRLSKLVIKEVERQLAERFPKTLTRLKIDWIVTIISSEEELSNTYLVRLLSTVINRKADLEVTKAPIEKALLSRGLSENQIDGVFNEIVSNLERKQRSLSLLKMVLNSANTKFFMERLLKENIRYNNPFACISFSVTGIKRSGERQKISPADILKVMNEVLAVLKALLRELDLIGSLGKLDKNLLFIILPMTNAYGADIVKMRLERKFSKSEFVLHGKTILLNVVLNSVPFNGAQTPDFKSYIEFIKKLHKLEEAKDRF